MLSIFSKQNAEHTRLALALRARPLDPAALVELNELLRTDHGALPGVLLTEVLDLSEKVLQESHDPNMHALLTEIHRSANWEIQSRYRAA